MVAKPRRKPPSSVAIATGVFGVIMFVVVGVLGRQIVAGMEPGTGVSRAGKATIERQIDGLRDQPGGAWVTAFQTDFPQEYAALRSKWADQLAQGLSRPELMRVSFDDMRAFTMAHRLDAEHASDATMQALARRSLNVIDVLAASDEPLCARFAMGTVQPQMVSPEAQRALGDLTTTFIHAAREGADHPQARPPRIAPGDARAFTTAVLHTGYPAQQLQRAVRNPAALSDHEQCAGSHAIYTALSTMPPATAARVYTVLMETAARQQAPGTRT